MSSRQVQRRKQREAERRGKTGGGGQSRGGGSVTARGGKAPTPWYLGPWGLSLALIVVIGVGYLIVKGQGANGDTTLNFGPAPAHIITAVTDPPTGTYATAGTGGMPSPWSAVAGNLPVTMVDGKPLLFYYGAEYCPHCGVLRWSLLNALSRFGKVSNMYLMKSSSTDTYPSTNTFTFVHSHYTSKYITFQPKEVLNRDQGTLQTPTAAQQAILDRLNSQGGFPFVYLANQAQTGTVPFNEGIFHTDPSQTTAGANSPPLTWDYIASQLKVPGSDLSENVFGEANWLTAGICTVTDSKPASVCDVAPIKGLVADKATLFPPSTTTAP